MAKVSVDSGTMMMVDPSYLFTSSEWARVMKCWKGGKRSYHKCIVKGLKKKGVRGAGVVVVATGGDGNFAVQCKKNDIVIRDVEACTIEK